MLPIVRPAIRRLRYSSLSLAERLFPVALPTRQEPLHVTFVFHVEYIADARVFGPFLDFVRWLRGETGAPATVCITTPHCPLTAAQMSSLGVSTGEYEARVAELATHVELGYHGHFYVRHASPDEARERGDELFGAAAEAADRVLMWRNGLSPMGPDAFDRDVVAQQIPKELAWLRERWGPVVAYLAGWWVLNEDIVRLLEEHGIEVDCSLRQGHANTFGGRYVSEDDLAPRGEPALLPPSERVVEIQSAFYPVVHPRRAKRLLVPVLSHKPDCPAFLAFPSHEDEAVEWGPMFQHNVRVLKQQREQIRWTSLGEQLRMAKRVLGMEPRE